METFKYIKNLIDVNIIYCLFPLILWLILIRKIFKKKFDTNKALISISWFIIIYTSITFIFFVFGMMFYPNGYTFTNRATGPYWWAYWLMFFCSTILPFSLFYKRLATKPLFLLLVVFFMKSGFYFERFVILITSLHRDYLSTSGIPDSIYSFIFLVVFAFFAQGFILAIILLCVLDAIVKIKKA